MRNFVLTNSAPLLIVGLLLVSACGRRQASSDGGTESTAAVNASKGTPSGCSSPSVSTFVGDWSTVSKRGHKILSRLKPDGSFLATNLDSRSQIGGTWKLGGNAITWTYDAGAGAPETNAVLECSKDKFVLKEVDGASSTYSTATPEARRLAAEVGKTEATGESTAERNTGRAAPAGAPEPPSVTGKRLAAFAPNARTSASFVTLPLWAVRPPGTMTCDGKTKLTDPPVDDGADESDQFKRHDKQVSASVERAREVAKRDEYRNSILGSLVYTTDALDLSPAEIQRDNLPDQSRGENVDHPFDVQIGEYDFGKGAYLILIRPKASTGWGIGVEHPVIRDETVSGSISTRRRTGVLVGGREVTVRGQEGFAYPIAQNHSRMEIPLVLQADEAKNLADRCKRKGLFSGFKGCTGQLRILQRVNSVGYHKVCNANDPWDNFYGIGDLFNSTTIGVEVEIDGQWVASMYDEAEIAKLNHGK